MVRKLIDWAVGNPWSCSCWPWRSPGSAATPSCTSTSRPTPTRPRPSSRSSPSTPGPRAEEVERQVTIPLEVALAGMPGLTSPRAASRCSACRTSRNQFDYGIDYDAGQAGGHQPAAARSTCPTGVTPADLAAVADRRDLPLHPEQPRGRPAAGPIYTLRRPEGAAGLDAASASSAACRASPTSSASAARSSATRSSPTRTG